MAKWLQKVLLKPLLKKGDKIEFYQEVYNNEKLDSMSGFRLKIKVLETFLR